MSGCIAKRLRLPWAALLAVAVAPAAISAQCIPDVLQGTWVFTMNEPMLAAVMRKHRQDPSKGMSRDDIRRLKQKYATYKETRTIGENSIRRDCSDGKASWREEWVVETTKVEEASFEGQITKVDCTPLSGEGAAGRAEAAKRLEGKRIRCRMDDFLCLEITAPGSGIELPGFFARSQWAPDASEKLDLHVDLEFQVLEMNCEPAAMDVMHVASSDSQGGPLVRGAPRLVAPGQASPAPEDPEVAVLSHVALTARAGQKAKARDHLRADELSLLLGRTAMDRDGIAAAAERCRAMVSATPEVSPDGYTATVSLDWFAAVPDIRVADDGSSAIASASEYSLRTTVVLWDKQSTIVQLDPRGTRVTRYLAIRMTTHAPRSGSSSPGIPLQVATRVQLLRVKKGASDILDEIARQKLPATADDVQQSFAERQRQAASAAFALGATDLVLGPALQTVSAAGREAVAFRQVRGRHLSGQTEIRVTPFAIVRGYSIGLDLRHTFMGTKAKSRFFLWDGAIAMVPLEPVQGKWHEFLFVSTRMVNPAGLPIRPSRPLVPNPKAHAAD